MHINEIVTVHLAAVEKLCIEEESGVEETLSPLHLVCFIDKTLPAKHKILLHQPRADVYYFSIGVKYCGHVSCRHRTVLSLLRLTGSVEQQFITS